MFISDSSILSLIKFIKIRLLFLVLKMILAKFYHLQKLSITEKKLKNGALGKPRGSGWRGRWEGGSGWGTHVNPWLFYSNV